MLKKFTTQDLEHLLNEATPGPWEVETIPELRYSNGETWEELGHHVVYGENGPLFATDEQTWEEAKRYQDNEANIRLAAHAPAAVTEVVRLRREIAAFRDQMTKSSEEYKAMYDRGRDLDHLLAAEYDDQIAYVLTRILEGEA